MNVSLKRWAAVGTAAGLLGCGARSLPPEVQCQMGGYRLADGAVLGLIPRSSGDVRMTFMTGETAVLGVQSSRFFESTPDADPSYRVEVGNCEDVSIRVGSGDSVRSGKKIAYRVQETRFSGIDGERLGRLVLPSDGQASAIAVSVHGSERSSGRTGGTLQTLLPAFGIGVFAYDKRGTGGSEGEYTQDFDILSGDAVRARREALRLYPGDVPVGYIGASQGGWVAPLAAERGGADFVVVAYGLAQNPLAEDREQVFSDLRAAGYGDDVLEKAREVTDATGQVMASGFSEGFDELDRVKALYGDKAWWDAMQGEFTGQFLSWPSWLLGWIGPFFDVGTSWTYEPRPVLEALDVPMLWVLAGRDLSAPSHETVRILRELQESKPELDLVVFPEADHGIWEFEESPDGKRTYTNYAPQYFGLVSEWIRTTEPTLSSPGPIVYQGPRGPTDRESSEVESRPPSTPDGDAPRDEGRLRVH